MQVTANIETTSDVNVTGTKFFEGVKALVTKVASVFQPKKHPKFSNANVSEAIQFIEWRTWYDQQRIINAVQTATALRQFPELCQVLNVQKLTYTSKQWREAQTIEKDVFHKLQLRTRELLLPALRNQTKTIKIEVADNNFDRKLVRFFGELSPRTKDLISGAKVADKTFAHKKMTAEDQKAYRILNRQLEDRWYGELVLYQGDNPGLLSLQHNMLEHDRLLLGDLLAQIPDEVRQTEIDVASATEDAQSEEKIINVIVETKETLITEPVVDPKLAKLRLLVAGKTSINKLTLPTLKLYASVHKIYVPGKATRIKKIKEIVVEAQGTSKIIHI